MRRGRSELEWGYKLGVGVVSLRGLLPGAFIKLTLLSRQYNHPDMF